MNKPIVTVLLSSYNGEKYIVEQIDSILAQEKVDVKLIVRDDGSSDSTPLILDSYKSKGKLDFYKGENIGWRRSFMQLALNAPESDYYAFSDQDDHWLPEKLSAAVKSLETLPSGPNLYMSNTYYWKDDVKVLTNKKAPNVNKDQCLIWCFGPGCTMVYNRELMEFIKKYPMNNPLIPHDQWFLDSAYLLGHVYYDMESYILYRQHENNQLGATIKPRDLYLLRFKQFKNLRKFRNVENRSTELLRCYGDLLIGEKKEACEMLAYYRKNMKNFLRLLFSNRFNNLSFSTTVGMKLRILFRHL